MTMGTGDSTRRLVYNMLQVRPSISHVILGVFLLYTGFLCVTFANIFLSSYTKHDRLLNKPDGSTHEPKVNVKLRDLPKDAFTSPEFNISNFHEIVETINHKLKNPTLASLDEQAIGLGPSKESNKSAPVGTKGCLRRLTLYSPGLAPLHRWKEYWNGHTVLEAAFRELKEEKTQYVFIECPGYSCDIALTPSASTDVLHSSDAVLINMAPREVLRKMHRISERLVGGLPPRVKIIFYAMESPLMMNKWDTTMPYIKYHYSWTYHSDSEVHFPYGVYIPGEPTDTEDINYAEKKTDLLVWAASNCMGTFWPRMEWVNKLKASIDIFGLCGSLTCVPRMSPVCTKAWSVYKFYLALENAECDEYITEKLWTNSLLNGLVPIVYGGRRDAYERLLPPNSFIHVSDFSSSTELIDYVKKIDLNDTLYNEFFKWRKLGRVERNYPHLEPQSFCKVLPVLSNDSPPPVKTVRDSSYFKSCRNNGHDQGYTMREKKWEPWR